MTGASATATSSQQEFAHRKQASDRATAEAQKFHATAKREARIRAQQKLRGEQQSQQRQLVRKLYPFARTFEVKHVEPVGPAADAANALAAFPRTFTLVTPDHDDPSGDHMFVGPYPVASGQFKHDEGFGELTFATSDGVAPIRGHLRVMGSRTRAYGTIEYGGHAFAVEYQIKPQKYAMRIGEGAAYTTNVGIGVSLKWDVTSDRWKNAKWSAPGDYPLDFTYGIIGTEFIGNQPVFDFYAAFDDNRTKQDWTPDVYTFEGRLRQDQRLFFGVAGANPPNAGKSLFPYQLEAQLSEFAMDFDGAMLTGRYDAKGTVYGLQAIWAGSHVAGLYRLGAADNPRLFVSVHGGELYVGHVKVPGAVIAGTVMRWGDLPAGVARDTGLTPNGEITFSQDGHQIVASSLGVAGERVHPDALAQSEPRLAGSPEFAQAVQVAQTAAPGLGLAELMNMSQFARDGDLRYYDILQQQAMGDFYQILQYYLPADYQKFFGQHPTLPPDIFGIAKMRGSKGTEPAGWYTGLGLPYTAASLGHWSNEDAAKTLNYLRADAWLTNQTATSDVMDAQMPLLYQRRYGQKYPALQSYLTDQRTNAASYASGIDKLIADWLTEATVNIDDPDQIATLKKQMTEIGQTAKDKKLWWALAVYAYASRTPYLNMLQSLLRSGDEIDGSEFTQRVQRTVALLNVLDPSSYFSQQYAYLLQLFQLSSVLPQLADYGTDFGDFNFALTQVLDAFVATYLNAADPKMADAAKALQDAMVEKGKDKLVSSLLALMRESSVGTRGLYSWANMVAQFESGFSRFFGSIPIAVGRLGLAGASALLMMQFATGQVKWSDLSDSEKRSLVMSASGMLSQIAIAILRRAVAFSTVWEVSWARGFRAGFRLFFSSEVLTRAQSRMVGGLRGWILETGAIREEIEVESMAAIVARRLAGGAAARVETTLVRRIFGRNLQQFMATRVAGALAVVSLVMSAIELAKGGDQLTTAMNSMFVLASALEVISIAGTWAIGTSSVAIGTMAVSSIFACVAVIGIIALLAGMIIAYFVMKQPQKSPIEEFAETAGPFYMPAKADIDYFEVYQPLNSDQRAGVNISLGGDASRSLFIGSDGTLRQAKFDASGNTAFYLTVDGFGRAQICAPLTDDTGKGTLFVLGLTKDGALTVVAGTPDTKTDLNCLWLAEMQGAPDYEEGYVPGSNDQTTKSYMAGASFKLYNAGWQSAKGGKRYLQADGTSGWKTSDGDGAVVKLKMVTTEPAGLTMSDISWYTTDHDKVQGPALRTPGSAPRKWSIDPQLPKGLTLDPDTGFVAMDEGVDVPAVAAATYTLTVTNGAGSATTTFSLAVQADVMLAAA